MVQASQFTAMIVCSTCGAVGAMTWEKVGTERSLVSLSKGFHERIPAKKPYLIELVCNNCGGFQPET